MEENSLAGVSFPILISLVIAGASILGALALQVGGNVLSDEISHRWRLNRRRLLKAQRLAHGLRLGRGRRRRARRPIGRRPDRPDSDLLPAVATRSSLSSEAPAERDLCCLAARWTPGLDSRAFAFFKGDGPLDEDSREKMIAAMQSRAAALLRRDRGRCRA